MLSVEVFGKSHDEYIGAVLYGIPSGEIIDLDSLSSFMKRRMPGTRSEADIPDFVSGITDGKTDGQPLKVIIKNCDVRPQDYDDLTFIPRPGHADYPAFIKWEGKEDMHGGGKFSGRMTAPLCAVGGICRQILLNHGISVNAEVIKLGKAVNKEDFSDVLERAASDHDSLGGVVRCTVSGMPVGIGDNLFDGLDGSIAYYVFGIPGCKGIEFGAGFSAAGMYGSENNDGYSVDDEGNISLLSNNAGGILGGMSDGEDIVFNAAFKPTPSIGKVQRSVDMKKLTNVELQIHGRHDVAYVLRVPPVVEACCSIAVLSRISIATDNLASLRCRVDNIDREISRLLSERFSVTDSIGRLKSRIRDESREEAVLNNIRNYSDINIADSVEQVYLSVMTESRRRQEKNKNA